MLGAPWLPGEVAVAVECFDSPSFSFQLASVANFDTND